MRLIWDEWNIQDKPIIGYQIVDSSGHLIHSTNQDPFNLTASEMLRDKALEKAIQWCMLNPGFYVRRVYEGDIENPAAIDSLSA
jgi:hypothetical protein